MLTKRVSNSSKPVKRIRTKNVDSVKLPKVQSISTTIPINFDVSMYINPQIGTGDITNTMVNSFDTISMLNSSETFQQLCKTFKMCKIRKVHGCIDVTAIPSVLYGYYTGEPPTEGPIVYESGNIPLSNTLLNCAMLRTVQLGKYFKDYSDVQDVKTYDDVVSIGSNIFQAMIPGTSVHLSPEIQASGMMERSQYLDTNIFQNLKMLKNYNATQYFVPTFYIAAKCITPTEAELKERVIAEKGLDPNNVTFRAFLLTTTEVKLSCQFYIDVIMKDLENNYASKPTAFVYSYLLCDYMGTDVNHHIARIPLFELGTTYIDDYSFYSTIDTGLNCYMVEINPYVGNYLPDTIMNFTNIGYLAVYVGASNVIIKKIGAPTANNFPEMAGYTRYYIRLDIKTDIVNTADVSPTFVLSGNALYDTMDFNVTTDPNVAFGNLAFMYNRTI